MGHSTTHISSHKFDYWIGGDGLVSYHSSDYPSMIHSKKYRSSYSLFLGMEDQYSAAAGGRGGIGTMTNHF